MSGFLLCLVLVLAGADELITRNVIVVLVPVIVLLAGGLGARRAQWLGLIGTATLCTIGLIAAIGVAADSTFQRPDWRAVARAIGSGRPVGAGRAILIERYPLRYPLALYLPNLRFVERRGAIVNELDVIAYKGLPKAWFCWWGSSCNVPPSELDTSIRLAGLRPDGHVLRAGRFTILRLRSATPIRLTPRNVSRALSTTVLGNDALLLQSPA